MAISGSNTWPKRISVDKRIVGILSKQTYDTFPNALKEIIMNSYDADASQVNVDLDTNKELITIEDDGHGMSEQEFEFFLRIAGQKRDKKPTTSSGRYRVGQFGVGFLSVFPFFKNYSIITTKAGNSNVVEASIPCHKYFSSNLTLDIGDIKIQGNVKTIPEVTGKQFTKIRLHGFSELTKEFFNPRRKKEARRYSLENLSGIEKLKWDLSENLPLSYEDKKYNLLSKKYSPNLSFDVNFNKKPLKRKLHANTLLEINNESLKFDNFIYSNSPLPINDDLVTIGNIKFQYFILTDKKAIHPYAARFFKIRNLNTGVGKRTAFGLGSEYGGGRSRIHWLTGELLILDGMNEVINVARDDFGFTASFENLQKFLRDRLRHHSNKLEKEAEYINEKTSQKIKNVKMLKPTGSRINDNESENNNKVKESVHPKEHEKSNTKDLNVEDIDFSKKIHFKGNTYIAKKDQWNYKDELFPACKLVNNKLLIVNENYPLFKQVKHTDIFIKLHLLILVNYKNDIINKDVYDLMVKQILDIYSDYKK